MIFVQMIRVRFSKVERSYFFAIHSGEAPKKERQRSVTR